MAHTLRKVDKDFTFDEQRVEINELAVDVWNLKHDLGDITLNDIDKVNVGPETSWVIGNIIKWNGTEWVRDIDVSGITLSVVYNPLTYDPVTEKRGDISYDGATGVFTWTPPELNFLTELGSIGGHTDVDVTTTAPADGNVLKWDSSVGTGGSWVPDTDSVGVTYSVQALASPGIQLLNDNNAQTSNRIFFDAGTGITLTRTVAPDASGGGTIKFEAATFTGTTVGFVPASTLAETSKYLKSDGSWDNPPNTEYDEFEGEAAGLVPASTANVSNKFLRSDGNWEPIVSTDTTYSQSAVTDSAGVKLRLTDSTTPTAVNDDIIITAGSGISITDVTAAGFTIKSTVTGGTSDGNDYVTDVALGTGVNAKKLTLSFDDPTLNQDVDLSSIDTNTEYELKAIDSSNDIILKLDADSSGTDDQVKIVAGTNITLTHNNEGEFKIDAAGGSGGGANVTISTTAPTGASAGDLWWHSEEGQLKIYYDDQGPTDDPDTQWVDTGGGGGNVGSGSSDFIGLSDTPGDFTNQAGKFLRVNVAEDGLEYVTGSATDLGVLRNGSFFKVTSNTGNDATLPLADTDNWGLMSDEMFDKLEGINFSTSLTVGAGAGSSTAAGVTLSDGLVSIRTGTGSVAAIDLYCESTNAHKISIKAPAHANFSGNQTFVLPGASGDDGDFLKTDGSGNTSWDTITNTDKLKDLTDTPNAYDNGKYLKSTATGTVWDTISTSSSNVTTNDTAPTTPSDGELWWDSNSGNLKVYYQDTNSSAWVDAINVTSDDTTNTLTSHFGQQSFPRFNWDKLTLYSSTLPGNQRYGVYRSANKTNRTGADLSTIFDGDNSTFVKITDHETNLFASNGSSQSTFMLVFDTPISDIIEIRLGMDGWATPGYNGVGLGGAIWNGTTNAGKQSGINGGLGRIDAPYEGKIDSAQEVILHEGSATTLRHLMFTPFDDPNTQNPPNYGNWSAGTAGDFITNLYYIKLKKSNGELIELTYDRNEDPSALNEYILDQWEIYGDSTNPQNMPEVLSTPNSNGRNVARSSFPFELVGGKGMAVDSNGIWTFPSPGVWKLDLNVPYYSTTTSTEMHQYLEYTDNDSAWKWISRSEGHLTAHQELYLRIQYTLNIKDITKQKIKIYTGGISGSSFYHPTGGGNMVSNFSSPYHVHRGGLTFEKVQRVNTTY